MALQTHFAEPERLQTRWLLIAVLLALLFHGGAAGVFHFYKIASLQTPNNYKPVPGPFTVKQVEINPKDLKTDEPDPTQHLPAPARAKKSGAVQSRSQPRGKSTPNAAAVDAAARSARAGPRRLRRRTQPIRALHRKRQRETCRRRHQGRAARAEQRSPRLHLADGAGPHQLQRRHAANRHARRSGLLQ